MGYSARYHATSLIAVFLALAIGILIGAEFGGDTLSNTRKDLEHSLTGNLQDARERADELSGELGRANEFSSRVYPVLVRDQLRGRRIGLIAFGDLPGGVYGAIEDGAGADRRRTWSASASSASRSTPAVSPPISPRPASPTSPAIPTPRPRSASGWGGSSSAAGRCWNRCAATSSRAQAATSGRSTR